MGSESRHSRLGGFRETFLQVSYIEASNSIVGFIIVIDVMCRIVFCMAVSDQSCLMNESV